MYFVIMKVFLIIFCFYGYFYGICGYCSFLGERSCKKELSKYGSEFLCSVILYGVVIWWCIWSGCKVI